MWCTCMYQRLHHTRGTPTISGHTMMGSRPKGGGAVILVFSKEYFAQYLRTTATTLIGLQPPLYKVSGVVLFKHIITCIRVSYGKIW